MPSAYSPASLRQNDWREPESLRPVAPAPRGTEPTSAPSGYDYESATFRIRPRFLVGENLSAGILSGVAGFVDVAGFVAVFGLFPAHLTGQLVAAAAAISDGASASHHAGVLRGLALIPLFVVAVGMATVVSRLARRRGVPPLTSLLGLMTFTLIMFWTVGMVLRSSALGPEDAATFAIGGGAVMSMGVQNALMREALGKCCPTTMMTGNLTQLIILIVEPTVSDGTETTSKRAPAGGRLTRVCAPLIGFGCGAALGAWLTSLFGLVSILVPTLVVGTLCLITWRQRATMLA